MADLEKILDGLNLPKQILNKSEALLKTLFGPSFDEIGGLIADNIRVRRFTNQLKIFAKAQTILKERNIDPRKVSLKVLAPLIEFSSYEEEETLQDKWSSLTAHILAGNGDIAFQQNCIIILNKLSTDDAILLDKFHMTMERKEAERLKRNNNPYQPTIPGLSPSKDPKTTPMHSLGVFSFNVRQLLHTLGISRKDLEFSLSNLVALGLLKWETDVQVSAERSSDDPEDKGIDVDVDVYNNDDFAFTPLGDKFVRVCKATVLA